MAGKKTKNSKQTNTEELQGKRRTRMLQIIFATMCIMVVLSMVLAAVSK
jgi:hypothetical protein